MNLLYLIYDLAFYRCHQMAQNSLFVNGLQFPLCARCTGITFGFLIGLVAMYLAKEHRSNRVNVRAMLLMMAPLAIDGGTQFAGLRESNFYLRISTGMLFGVFAAYALNAALRRKGKPVPGVKGLAYSGAGMVLVFVLLISMISGPAWGVAGDIVFWALGALIPLMYLYVVAAVLSLVRFYFAGSSGKIEKKLKATQR